MKKFIILTSCILFSCLSLFACSTDFSGTIEGAMNNVDQTVQDMAGPFLKEDESFKDDENKKEPEKGEEESNEN